MPTKPKAPAEDLVDPDALDDLGEDDALDDEFDLQDLEPVFTEEAPMVSLDDTDTSPEEQLEALPEDELLGADAPIDWDDEDDDAPSEEEGSLLDDEVDWAGMLEDDAPGLPVLEWSQEVFVEELGRTLPAELDPTAESTTWFRPDVSRAAHRLNFKLGGHAISTFPSVVRSSTERLRIGRDILSGRFLVSS